MNLEKITKNIENSLQDLSKFTATPGNGVTRLPYTKEAKMALTYLKGLMEEAGLVVHVDNTGSLIGRLEGIAKETIMVGSHYDSVKNGGSYDGIAGIICAIEAIKEIAGSEERLKYSLEVIATNDEEGARFHAGLFTGKALLGKITTTQLQDLKDADGISIFCAMQDFGLQPQNIAKSKRDDIKAFLEVHIEQGPILETNNKELGVVDVIVGIKRVLVKLKGRADHSGTMPMLMRKDAMEFAAKVINNIGDRARLCKDTVATVGFLQVEPNVMNIIPQQVSFTVDIRSVDSNSLLLQYDGLSNDLDYFSKNLGMEYELEVILDEKPVPMNNKLKILLAANCRKNKFSYMNLASGAGHDAQIFGEALPAAMLFVPSKAGRSHCPEESSKSEDLAKAVVVLKDLLQDLQKMNNLDL